MRLRQFLHDIEDYLDPSSLEVAWELLVEDGEAVTPAAMASFLFSEQTAQGYVMLPIAYCVRR
jgi:exoribonuclease-2